MYTRVYTFVLIVYVLYVYACIYVYPSINVWLPFLSSVHAVTSFSSENDIHFLKTESDSKSRRKNGTRSVFSYLQRNLLERHYQRREYVTKGERYHIAMEVGITEEQVKIWFQNRRTKKKKLERSNTSAKKSQEPEWFYDQQ